MENTNSYEHPVTVFVVDDDPSVLESLAMLMRSAKYIVETFSRPTLFLEKYDGNLPGCLVLDVRMPEMSGLELQEKLNEMDIDIPIVFITGHATVPMAVRATQRGAVDFLEKPFTDETLLDCVQRAIAIDAENRKTREKYAAVDARLGGLTVRERQVVELVVDGKNSREVAEALGLSEKTISHYRARIMLKLQVDTVADLVRTVVSAGVRA
jgi:RNA polymerase sigma factor (sigma-70 family)